MTGERGLEWVPMNAIILSTNLGRPQPDPGGARRQSGIDKRPVDSLEVFAPGPNYGDGSGVVGDTVGDVKHHGGAQKAVYAFSREQLDYWQERLGREFLPGSFGENLTTEGIDLSALLINQRVRVGTAELEVSTSRQPCRTFGAWIREAGWLKAFIGHGHCGAYFRVATPGVIRAGDPIELVGRPDHDVDMFTLFAANTGDKQAARRVVEARCMPEMYRGRFEAMLR